MEYKKIMLLFIILSIIMMFPTISADIIFKTIDETSQASFNKNPDLEIRDARVVINKTEKSLKAIFYIHSNEKEIINSSVYLKAKGKSCYDGNCRQDQFKQTRFQLRYEKAMAKNSCKWMKSISNETVDWENYYACTLHTEDYETKEGIFQKTKTFKIYPNDTFILYVEQYNIEFPFQYYLDSLSTFKKAEHEKITIYGENLSVTFNKQYPIKKISKNKWVWEYNNINTQDPTIKDILTINKGSNPPKKSFLEKIVIWLRNLFK